jgi:hypothetical protein
VPLDDHIVGGYNIALPENWFCSVAGWRPEATGIGKRNQLLVSFKLKIGS